MALIKNFLILAVAYVLVGGQGAEEGHHNNDDWSPSTQQKLHEHNLNNEHDCDLDNEPTWVSCDFTITPRMRCQDCNTRLICKRVGGLLLDCPSPHAPYCNNGLCSPVPSIECA